MSIYVGNLSYKISQEHLSAIFSEFGEVMRVQLPIDRETGRLRGFAFIKMGTGAEEKAAIEGLNGAKWRGCDLQVRRDLRVNQT